MNEDSFYDWAAKAAAELVNRSPHPDPFVRYNAALEVMLKAIRLAAGEMREAILKPSRN